MELNDRKNDSMKKSMVVKPKKIHKQNHKILHNKNTIKNIKNTKKSFVNKCSKRPILVFSEDFQRR